MEQLIKTPKFHDTWKLNVSSFMYIIHNIFIYLITDTLY